LNYQQNLIYFVLTDQIKLTNMQNFELEGNRTYEQELSIKAAITSFMTKVYGWMTFALVITALTAFAVANSEQALTFIFSSKYVFYGLIIAEFGLVIAISAAINKLSYSVLSFLFVLYSLINGATISVIFLAYTMSSIANTFVVCAAMFGSMSVFGFITKKDLSGLGKIMIMGLIGIIIASIVNIFTASSTFDWIISFIGVIVFVGLTAYDTQKLKNMSLTINNEEMAKKLSIIGTLTLYLDFINLFLYLLKFLGNKKN